MISTKDIEKLAALARIKLAESEKQSLSKEIDSILEYVGQIQSASSGASKLVKVERELPEHRNVFRDDTAPHQSGIHTETLLAEAPEREGNYLKVKDIF